MNITNGADLGETLRVIGFQAQKSVLPSKDVKAQLPALDLYNVTVHEALDAILRVNGYVYKEQGNFIYVYSAKEAADMEKAARTANAADSSSRSEVGRRGGESGSYDDWTVEDLRERAAELDIGGRSSMSKDELIDALRNH